MMKGLLPRAIKGLLILSNNLIILMGVIVLGFGIFAFTDGRSLTELVEYGATASGKSFSVHLYKTGAVLLIVISCIVVVVAFLGCCGAWKENRAILLVYYVSLLTLFMCVIGGATIALTQSIYVIKAPLEKSLELYDQNSNDTNKVEVTRLWDDVQKSFGCCGVDSFQDWTSNSTGTEFPTPEGYKVPDSCCAAYAGGSEDEPLGNLEDCRLNPQKLFYSSYMDGCLNNFSQALEANSRTISAVTITTVLFMFVNLVTLFCFALLLHPGDGYQMV